MWGNSQCIIHKIIINTSYFKLANVVYIKYIIRILFVIFHIIRINYNFHFRNANYFNVLHSLHTYTINNLLRSLINVTVLLVKSVLILNLFHFIFGPLFVSPKFLSQICSQSYNSQIYQVIHQCIKPIQQNHDLFITEFDYTF